MIDLVFLIERSINENLQNGSSGVSFSSIGIFSEALWVAFGSTAVVSRGTPAKHV
ncbi:hypothetical protein [Roseibium algae]|uniref:Uncharacterized protein n=1 Tax=Roseibium algae TaxID=3123038 RepID=A0ABU8THQ1_9HYPH